MSENTLLKVKDLKVHYPIKKGILRKTVGHVKAVDGVSLTVNKGETLGIVGESGCGKSTLARSIIQLQQPTSGEIIFEDKNIVDHKQNNLYSTRRDIQMVFQDPYMSLNPRMRVSEIIAAPLKSYNMSKNLKKDVLELMDMVGLNPDHYNRYPHEFSGGQRQRIGIARAIAIKPKLIICDEPVSALDVSVQAQVLNLFKDLQKELNLTYIFIAHDLSAVKNVADRVDVMYLGKVMESSNSNTFYRNARHPYTNALLSAIPNPDPIFEKNKEKIVLKGDVPSPINPPSGCVFHTRCPRAQDYCKSNKPTLKDATTGSNHKFACFFPVAEKHVESEMS